MNRKEFKEKLFSYCKLLGYEITKYSVEFKSFTIFLFSPYDNTFHYIPIPPKREVTSLKRIKINYNEETLEIYKHIARKWYIIFKEYEIKKKIDSINQDFE
jgi:hypothetical protein